MTASRSPGEARREALLDAALACFEEHGLVRTGIEDIRRAAGASPSSVYHLFKGLPDLIAALLERTFVRRFHHVTAAVLPTRTAKAAVHALVEAHLAWVFGNAAEARFMYRALALDLHDEHRDELRATKNELKAEMTAHLVRLGVLASNRSAEGMIDVLLLGTTHQACRAWVSAPGTIDARWMKEKLPGLAWRTVRASKA
jgi:AcrR family transcriptional regulator